MTTIPLLHRITGTARAVGVAAVIGASAVLGGASATVVLAPPAGAAAQPGMFGDPAASARNWQVQTFSDSCVLVSVAAVVGDLTGQLPSESEMIVVAGLTPSSAGDGPVYTNADDVWGTWMPDALVLLDEYGIDADITDVDVQAEGGLATGLGPMKRYLASGSKVIASVNPNVLWGTDGDHTSASHVVVVTGIDTKDGVVHLNDSALEGGRDKRVPIEVFNQAWETSGYMMVVTD